MPSLPSRAKAKTATPSRGKLNRETTNKKQPVARSVAHQLVEEIKAHSEKQHSAEAHPGEHDQVEANSKGKQPVTRSIEQQQVEEIKAHSEKQHSVEAHPGEQHQVEANSKGKQPVTRSIEQQPVEEVEAHSEKQNPAEAHPGEHHQVEANSEKPAERSVEQHPVKELSIGALNFFLYFIVPLFIFNYLGTFYHSESVLVIALQVVFFIALVIWWFAMALWAFHKLARRKGVLPLRTCEGDPCEMRCNACCYIFGCVVTPLVLFVPIFLLMDLSQVFLFTCIVESVWALSAKAKLHQKLWALLCHFYKCLCTCDCTECFTCNCHCTSLEFFQGLYIFVTVGLLAAAFGVFQGLRTTDKTASPEDSRDLNKECGILGFFDWHDLWHFLSSFALLMGAFVIMFISAEPKNRKTARWNGTEMSEFAARESAAANESVDGNNMAAGT